MPQFKHAIVITGSIVPAKARFVSYLLDSDLRSSTRTLSPTNS